MRSVPPPEQTSHIRIQLHAPSLLRGPGFLFLEGISSSSAFIVLAPFSGTWLNSQQQFLHL